MKFETNFEFNEQEFCLKVSNDDKVVSTSIACVGTPMLWACEINLNDLVETFDFLDGCFFKPLDLAEYLEYQINNQEFRLESADEESKVLHLIFWVQKEKEDEIEQYEFYFPLIEQSELNNETEKGKFKKNSIFIFYLIKYIFRNRNRKRKRNQKRN